MPNEVDGEAPPVVAQLVKYRTRNSMVVASEPTDEKGNFSSTLIPFNWSNNYYTTAKDNVPYAFLGLIVCWIHLIIMQIYMDTHPAAQVYRTRAPLQTWISALLVYYASNLASNCTGNKNYYGLGYVIGGYVPRQGANVAFLKMSRPTNFSSRVTI